MFDIEIMNIMRNMTRKMRSKVTLHTETERSAAFSDAKCLRGERACVQNAKSDYECCSLCRLDSQSSAQLFLSLSHASIHYGF